MSKTTPFALSLFVLINFATNSYSQTEKQTVSPSETTSTRLTDEKLIEPKYSLSAATASIAQLDEKEFNLGFIVSPYELLQGKVAGVSISSNSGAPVGEFTITVHGTTSFNSSNALLVVIDNIPQHNVAVTLNPNDIAAIVVLKDAAATALYNEAANGVVLITTKRGTKDFNIRYTTQFSMAILPKEIDVFSAREYRALMNEHYAGNTELLGQLGSATTNWQEEIFQKAIGQDHFLSLSGTTKVIDMPYRISMGKLIQEGILQNSKYDRTTTNINLDPTFFEDHLKLNLNFRGTWSENNSVPENAIANAVFFDPTQSVYNQGQPGGYFSWQNNPADYDLAPLNPVAMVNLNNKKNNIDHLSTNINIDYKFHFLPDLKIILNAGADNNINKSEANTNPSGIWLYQMANDMIRTQKQTTKNNFWELNLRYSKNFEAIESKINFTLGQSQATSKQDFAEQTSTDFKQLDPNTPYLNQPGFSTQSNTFNTSTTLSSRFAGATVNTKNRYFASINIRQDGSSTFDSNKWMGTFYAAALGWNVKNERFLVDNRIISELKLRSSIGTTATGTDPLRLTNNPIAITQPFDRSDNAFFNREKSNLTCEKTQTLNFGMDFGFLNNRITGSLDYYNKKGSDLMVILIGQLPSPYTTNQIAVLGNPGEITSSGFDIALNAKIIASSNWKWTLNTNLNYSQVEIQRLTDIDNNTTFKGLQTGKYTIYGPTDITFPYSKINNYSQIQSAGHPLNSFYLYKQSYDQNGNPIEGKYNDYNYPTMVDKNYSKKATPTVLVGIGSKIQYKQWDFSFSGRLSLDNYVYNNIAAQSSYNQLYSAGYGTSNIAKFINKSKFENSQYESDYYLENASFFRMDYMSLGYEFDKILNKKLGINLSATVQNAFVITSYSGQDPEVVGGIDYCGYPRPRIFALKINLIL